uniref:Uncharacterized protein n=1 Tax=Cyprinodon variegatus TaxID=28743 RepID=A0A3Q2CA72_CYPVA
MPGANAGHLSQPLVGLSGELLCVNTPTFETMAFGDSDDINHLILAKDSENGHSFLQVLLGPLHLHNVSLLLLYGQQSHLESHKGTTLSSCHFLLYLVNAFFLLFALKKKNPQSKDKKGTFSTDFFSQLNICVLHTPVPIKSTPALVTEMLSKDCFQSTQTPDRPNITHNPHHNDGRGLNDGYSLHFLSLGHLFVHTKARAVNLPHSVCHPSLISQEGSEVDRVAGVVFWPRADPTSVPLAAPSGQEPHVPVTWGMELTVRLKKTT